MTEAARLQSLAADEPVDPIREKLVASAALVFAEKGYDGAGVAEIARRAGYTTGAIYGRFTGKAELLLAAIEARSDSELDQLFSRVNHLLRETSDQLTGKFFEHARGGQQLVRQNRGFE